MHSKLSTDNSSPLPAEQLSPELRRALLDLATAAIDYGLQEHRPLEINLDSYPPLFRIPRATFVTLQMHGRLRGCIGSLEPHRPLAADIAYNAYAAAFRDRRFSPLTVPERNALDIHISLLSLPTLMTFNSEADLLTQLRPGIDGLILEERGQRGTFLPSVWESLTNPRDFLNHLKVKAGLQANYWSPTIHIARYTTESFP